MFDGDNIFSGHATGGIGLLARFNIPEFNIATLQIPKIEGLSLYLFIPNFGRTYDSFDPEFPWLPGSTLTHGGDELNSDSNDVNRHRALRVFQRTWFTAGYKINDEMHARIQFIGANPSGSINWKSDGEDVLPYRYRVSVTAPRFEAAFAYSTDNYGADFGVKTWLPISNWITDTFSQDPDNPGYIRGGNPGTFWGGLAFGLGAFYKVNDDIRLNARFDLDMLRSWKGPLYGSGVDTKITNPTRMSFHVWPSYRLPNKMVVMATAGFNFLTRNTVDIAGTNPNDEDAIWRLDWERSNRLRFGCGLSLAVPLFTGASMNLGFAYNHGTRDTRGGEPRSFTIPITLFVSM
jgi:hypothetical protein